MRQSARLVGVVACVGAGITVGALLAAEIGFYRVGLFPGNLPGNWPTNAPGNTPGNTPGHAPGISPGISPGNWPGNWVSVWPGNTLIPTNAILQDPSLGMSSAMGVSADGRVVVGHFAGRFQPQPFRWTRDAGMQWLPLGPGTIGGEAYAASADGERIVGSFITPAAEPRSIHGGWNHDRPFLFPGPTGIEAQAVDITPDGLGIVGTRFDPGPTPGTILTWIANTPTPTVVASANARAFSMSDDARVVVGRDNDRPALWNVPTLTRIILSGGPGTAWGISGDGSTIVGHLSVAEETRAAIWNANGTLRWISPDGSFSRALAASYDGSVVVGQGWSGAVVRGADGVTRSVRNLVAERISSDVFDWWLTSASGVSADGTVIVGSGFNPQGRIEGFVAVFCPCAADFDRSGGVPDVSDLIGFFEAFNAGEPSSDVDCTGGVADIIDVEVFFAQWLAGGC